VPQMMLGSAKVAEIPQGDSVKGLQPQRQYPREVESPFANNVSNEITAFLYCTDDRLTEGDWRVKID
jgi:hypothetical protein